MRKRTAFFRGRGGGGMRLATAGMHTGHAEFAARRRQNYACSRLQSPLAENFVEIFADKKRDARRRLFFGCK